MTDGNLFPSSGMQLVVQGETDPKRWPYRFHGVEDAFDLETDTTGIQLLCVGCMDPVAPYLFGKSGRTSVRVREMLAFMRRHVAEIHPTWVIDT